MAKWSTYAYLAGSALDRVMDGIGILDVSDTTGGPDGTNKLISPDELLAPVVGNSISYPGLWRVPSSPSAYDDEFEGSSLDAKWTKNPVVTANGITTEVANGRLKLIPSNYAATARLYGIAQEETGSGDFKIWANISSPIAGTDAYNGLIVGISGGAGKGHVFGIGPNGGFQVATMGATYNEGGSDWSGFDGFNNATTVPGWPWMHPSWHRIRWDDSDATLYFDYSFDEETWITYVTRAGMARPNRIGLGMYAQANPAGWAARVRLIARCFRHAANSDIETN